MDFSKTTAVQGGHLCIWAKENRDRKNKASTRGKMFLLDSGISTLPIQAAARTKKTYLCKKTTIVQNNP